eukprot:251486_1
MKLIRYDSLTISQFFDNNYKQENDLYDNKFEIDIPIAVTSVYKATLYNDLSINSLLLKLSHFIDNDNNYKLWTSSLIGPIKNYNYLNDFKQKELTTPHFELTHLVQNPEAHFWRIIKFLIRYNNENWTLSTKNINLVKKYYNLWLNNYTNYWCQDGNGNIHNEACSYRYKWWTRNQFQRGYAKTYKHFEIMLKVCNDIFDCNKQLALIISNNNNFRNYWINQGLNKLNLIYPNTINENQHIKIKQLFKKYGYPIEVIAVQ